MARLASRSRISLIGLGMAMALTACDSNGSYTLGGSISGLASGATGLVLASDGATVSVPAGATTFRFPEALPAGAAYSVTVQSAPSGETCSVAGGTGVLNADVSNVVVTCAERAYTVGGTIVLAKGSSSLSVAGLVLANGTDAYDVPSGASTFTMPMSVAQGSSYQVTVKSQPTGMSCAVNPAAASTMPANNVTNVVVTCTDQPYALGGTVTVGSPTGASLSDQGLVIKNTSNSDTYTFASNASSFKMPMSVAYGGAYSLTVTGQPTGLSCAISNPSGTMPAAAVSLKVTCSDLSYSVSGTVTINSPNGVTGLSDQGLVLGNSANGDSYTFTSNSAAFAMPLAVPYGSAYLISVGTQPTGLNCSVSDPSTTMPASNVTTVAVTCADKSYTLGGQIVGLGSATGLIVTNNGADSTSVPANASTFALNTAVPYDAAYQVAVAQSPAGLSCSVTQDASGTMPAASVSSVQITCDPVTLVTITVDYTNGTVLLNGTAATAIDFNSGSIYQINVLLPGLAVGSYVSSPPQITGYSSLTSASSITFYMDSLSGEQLSYAAQAVGQCAQSTPTTDMEIGTSVIPSDWVGGPAWPNQGPVVVSSAANGQIIFGDTAGEANFPDVATPYNQTTYNDSPVVSSTDAGHYGVDYLQLCNSGLTWN